MFEIPILHNKLEIVNNIYKELRNKCSGIDEWVYDNNIYKAITTIVILREMLPQDQP